LPLIEIDLAEAQFVSLRNWGPTPLLTSHNVSATAQVSERATSHSLVALQFDQWLS
jgi:hypothetical protein